MKWLSRENYSIPTVLALGLHGIVVIAGLIAIDFGDDEIQKAKKPVIVNATVVDISQTIIGKQEAKEKAAKQKQAALAEKKKKEAEQNRKKKAQQKALEDKKRKLAQAKQAEKKEAERKKAAAAEAIKKEKAEKQRIAKENEKKRLAKEAEKQRLAKEAANKEKQKEQARKAEAERLANEERKRQEELVRQAEQQRIAEAAAAQAAEEAERLAAAEAQMVQSISSLIHSRVTAAWIRPPNARNNMKAQLRINFLPNGEVMNVQVTKSSGDLLFDQRTVDAVYKVRRIEELADVDSYIFERNFRQVDLIFNPQDLRN